MTSSKILVLFEPWHLGDVLIAAGIAFQDPGRLYLACNPRWHPILLAVSDGREPLTLLSVDLPYINKIKPKPWQLGELPASQVDADVASIRGDLRDYIAVGKLFPQSKRDFSGWTAFGARRSRIINFPFARGWLPIRNRYRAWATITGTDWQRVEAYYRSVKFETKELLITIHIGAQWRVRQFPYVAEVAALLRRDARVQVIAGESDLLPDGVTEPEVLRLVDRELVETLRQSTCVITNDSGPMHLAALVGCSTIVVSRISAIQEWIPPGVTAVISERAPKGYMPDAAYQSESVVDGWPTASEVLKAVHAVL